MQLYDIRKSMGIESPMTVRTAESAKEQYEKANAENGFSELVKSLQIQFDSLYGKGPVFKVNMNRCDRSKNITKVFIENLPKDEMNNHICSKCNDFLSNYGELVTIIDDKATSLLWNPDLVPDLYKAAVAELKQLVEDSDIESVFYADREDLGVKESYYRNDPETRIRWEHLHLKFPKEAVKDPETHSKSISAMMAFTKERYMMLTNAAKSYSPKTIRIAIEMVRTDAELAPHKFMNQLEWLLEFVSKYQGAKHLKVRENIIWVAVADAPHEWAYIRTSSLGKMLEDIQDGLDATEVKSRFMHKIDPETYKRPDAEPSEGLIEFANKKIVKFVNSLKRRFARPEELVPYAIWVPEKAEPPKVPENDFFHMLRKEDKSKKLMTINKAEMSWAKFENLIMPTAKSIRVIVPYKGNYMGILTATDIDAPPILKWDSVEARNPFSSYCYLDGSFAEYWGLAPASSVPVTLITRTPGKMIDANNHYDDGIAFILEGVRDSHADKIGIGLFPDIITNELYDIRKVIESYSNQATLDDLDNDCACGMLLTELNPDFILEVETESTKQLIRITSLY